MYLKRLEILGFKTFAEKTEILFAPGVTAVVGPNGSGKSNIADAILWVLGENNVRSLRGSTAQDIIFAGNEKRKPLGMAEVALTIDNSARILPLDFSEVTVTRRIYRSGESECFINKVACRLKDIYELFLDTGVGRDAYSMVNQGEIDAILSVRAEDRRAIFEEAAGIKKYRHRKREAERKLEATQQNLLRLTDVMSEIESQLGPLSRQASAASRYGELAGRLQTLETAWFGTRLRRLGHERRELQELQGQLVEEERRLDTESTRASAAEGEAATQLAALDERLEALRRREASVLEQLSTLDVGQARTEERAAQLAHRLETTTAELVSLEEQCARRDRELEVARLNSEEQQQALGICRERLGHAQELARRQQSEYDRCRRELAERQRQSVERIRQEAAHEKRLAGAQLRVENLAETERRLAQGVADASDGLARAQAAAAAAETALVDGEQRVGQAENEVARVARDLEAAEASYAALAGEIEGIRRDLASRGGRRQALAAMAERGEGAASGARSLLAAARASELPGRWDILAEAVRVPDGLERAVEAALGPYTDAMVAGSEETALQGLAWLRERGEWAILFAPCGRAVSEVEGSLSTFVAADGPVADVVRTLLADVVLVDELPTGESPGGCPGARLWVTSRGEWRSASGGFCGGAEASERALAAAQSRRREIERLDTEISEEQARLQSCEFARRSVEASREDARGRLESARQLAADLRAGLETARREQARLRNDFSRARQVGASAQEELDRARHGASLARAELEGLQDGGTPAGTVPADQDDLDVCVIHAQERESEWRSAESEVADLRVELASLEREAAAAASAATGVSNAVRQVDSQRLTRESERQNLEREIASLSQDGKDSSSSIEEMRSELAEARAALSEGSRERQDAARRATELSNAARNYSQRLQELAERRHRAEVELAAATSEESRLADQWRGSAVLLLPAPGESEDPDLEQLMQRWEPQAADQVLSRVPDPEGEIQRLRRQIRNLGPINADAVEEFARQSERRRFLDEQKNDLESAQEQILSAIGEIDAASKETFQNAFEQIGAAFDEMFGKLFGGGCTELRLTDPDDILETGIEIMVQPPGKRRQNLLLLSGGERALTAAAMLFALLKVRPSPFCVLDEVDAPLDEANVARFGEVLREFSARSQFIIVTHNRGSMEAADTLYGITMQEKGLSRVLSCTLTDDLAQFAADDRRAETVGAGTR
jgi:chromosome segregation protein